MKKMIMMGVMAITMLFGFTAPAVAQEYIYVLTNQLTSGEYLIVNSNSNGPGQALSNGSTYRNYLDWGNYYAEVDKKTVSIIKDTYLGENYYYIESANVDAASKWTVGGSTNNWTFSKSIGNLTYYIRGYDLNISENNNNNKWRWDAANNRLYYIRDRWPLSDQTWYLYYDNSFSTDQTQNSVYLYKKILRPQITANPTSLSFETITGISTTKTITVKGSNLQGNITATVSGNGFSINPNPTTISKANAERNSGQEITVTFNPTTAGNNYSGTITLTSSYAQTVTIDLTGTAHDPSLTATPASLSFETITGVSTSKTFTLKGSYLKEGVTPSVTGTGFSINPTSISKDEAQSTEGKEIIVTFNPTTAGTVNGTVTLTSAGAQDVTVNLTGVAHDPSLAVDPTSLSFETITGIPTTQTFTLTGTYLKEGVTASVTGTGFSINPTTISKDDAQSTEGKEITVTFNPTTAGTVNGTVTLTSAGAQDVTVNLTGIAHDPSLAVDPAELTLNTEVGTPVTGTFNVSGEYLKGEISVTLTDENGVFSVSPTSFAKTTENTASGTVTVTFSPTALGTYNYTGSITITSTDATSVVVPLTGTVNVPEVAADKDEMKDFWQAPDFEHTQSFTLTASNISDNVTIEVSNGSLYKVSADGTNFANSVTVSAADAKADGGKTVYIQFKPAAYGENLAGTISIKCYNTEFDQITLSGRSYGQDVSVSTANVTTFYYDKPLVIPYDSYPGLLNVLYIKSLESDPDGHSNEVNMQEVYPIIPIETGVLIFANSGTYRFPVYNDYKNELNPISDNLLKGSLTGTKTKDVIDAAKEDGAIDPIVLTLGREPGKTLIGFFHYTGTNLAKNKAYLIYDWGSSDNNVNFFSIGGSGSEYTAIQKVENVKEQTEDGAWYTLQGVRLSDKPTQRGIYLHNGKKIMVK